MAKRRWSELSPKTRGVILVLGTVQVLLIGIAHADISRRAPEEIRGPKRLWRLATLVSFVGPIAYFVAGRREL